MNETPITARSPSTLDLRGKTAVVIGGSSGIGLAAAKGFADRGATVAISSRSAEKLEKAKGIIGGSVTSEAFDGADEEKMASFMAGVGAIDYLVIAAGGGGITGPLHSLDLAEFRRAFERKFWVQVAAAKLGGPRVTPGGSITLVTGIFGLKAVRGNSGVSAVNGALNAMVGPLAIEFAPVRVNAISPGLVDSPYWDRLQPEAKARLFAERARNHLVGRVGQPGEVADFVLAVALNSFMSGAVIPMDGGFLLPDRA
jgi:NAD(P)-dependent dehydrogenase (short-subunit alcohol dehydrogenase family)